MSKWVYYQLSDNKEEKWGVAAASDIAEIKRQAMLISTLALSDVPSEHHQPDWDSVLYQGDFWIDIDAADISDAITSVRGLADWLESLKVDLNACQWFASGGKGFHVCIPAVLFNGGKPEKHLYMAYRCFADAIVEQSGVRCVDRAIYSGKRGRLLRVENKLRSNGKYKVPLTVEEVRSITADSYGAYVSTPRPEVKTTPRPVPVHALDVMFREARTRGAQAIDNRRKMKPGSDVVLKQFKDSHPLCITWTVNQLNLKRDGSVTLNGRAMNLAAYIKDAGVPAPEADKLIKRLAERCEGHSGAIAKFPTVAARVEYIYGILSAVQDGEYNFACGANKALLDGNPCDGCPMRQHCVGMAEVGAGIVVTEKGMFRYTEEGEPRLILDFCLEPIKKFRPEHARTTDAWEALTVKAIKNGEEKGEFELLSDDFNSGSAFKSAISGVMAGSMYLGSDQDPQRIQSYLFEAFGEDIDVVQMTKLFGVQRFVDNEGGEGWVYVEPGWSLNHRHVTDTFKWAAMDSSQLFSLKNTGRASGRTPEDVDVFLRLLNSNREEVVSTVLGWMCACHVKEQFFSVLGCFPLLHLYGDASSGKTQTVRMYTPLAGANYLKDAPHTAAGLTPLPLKSQVTCSTTIPRVYDEVRRSQMNQKEWTTVIKYLKAAYNRNSTATGNINGHSRIGGDSRGISVEPATSPMIYMATERVSAIEVKERSIAIEVPSKAQRTPLHTDTFRKLEQEPGARERLARFARLMMEQALRVDREQMAQMVEEARAHVPEAFGDRHIDNHTALYVGFQHLLKSLRVGGFPKVVVDKVTQLRDGMVSRWKDTAFETVVQQEETELVRIMRDFARMAQCVADKSLPSLTSGVHYIRSGGVIHLNLEPTYLSWMLFTHKLQKRPEYEDSDSFLDRLKTESFFIGVGPVPGMPAEGLWVSLDREKLRERGVRVEAFG